jgi:alanine racemase
MKRAGRIRLDAQALRHNLAQLRTQAGGRRIWAVIKAEAYGHGLHWAARHLSGQADGLAVSCLEEAMALREAGIRDPLLVLQGPRKRAHWRWCRTQGLQPVLHEHSQLQDLEHPDSGIGRGAGRGPLPGLWIKLDSGMHRLGFPLDIIPTLADPLHRLGVSEAPLGWMTHLACADLADHPLTARQLAGFRATVPERPHRLSVANSAAILRRLWAHPNAGTAAMQEWLRPGLLLYGASPLPGHTGSAEGFLPAMTVEAPLIAIQSVPPGDCVGYGATWCAKVPTRLGIVAMGYADGYPRHAPSGTAVRLHNRHCPLVGRVSMDMLGIDISTVPAAQVGDWVTLWGQGLPVEALAEAAGTISYELLTRVADRLQVEEV